VNVYTSSPVFIAIVFFFRWQTGKLGQITNCATIAQTAINASLPVTCTGCRSQNDELLRLPSQTSADGSCLPCHGGLHLGGSSGSSDDGPEQVVSADDYVRQKFFAAAARPPSSVQQPSSDSPPVVRWRNRRRLTSVRTPIITRFCHHHHETIG